MNPVATPPVRERLEALLAHMSHQLFEKEQVLAMALLSAIARESIFLLGPPGVAKSMVARRLKLAFKGGKAFEYLMGKFSTPDEVFGPVSISRLKNEDKYLRMVEHYLPGAQVVFLDEIWKASPPIQNALLTVLNEKVYRNGEQEMHVDIRGLISASNELPTPGEGLEALWDRFLIRMEVLGIESEDQFEHLLKLPQVKSKRDPVPEELKITDEEYQDWQLSIDQVVIPAHILGLFHELRRRIRARNVTADPDQQWYISDRRWRKMAHLLRTCAFIHDRAQVILADLFLLSDCMWDRYEQREEVQDLLLGTIVAHGYDRLIRLGTLRSQLELWQEEIADQTRWTKILEINQPKTFRGMEEVVYYQILQFRGTDPAYLRADDWELLQGGDEKIIPIFELKERNFRAFQRIAAKRLEQGGIRLGTKDTAILHEMVEEKKIVARDPDPGRWHKWDQQAKWLLSGCEERLKILEEQVLVESGALQTHLFLLPDQGSHVRQAQTKANRQILDLKIDIQKTRHSYEEGG